jgi:mycofactocin system creatininase family protein
VTNLLSETTWSEVDAHRRAAVLVPLGSLEQHGPHLPLDTDTRIAVAVATAAAAGRGDVAFPGTLSIGTAALAEMLVELGRDASRHWGALLLVNAHGGNAQAVALAVARLSSEGRVCAAFSVAPAGGDAHAGRTETSLLLHLDPGVVREGLAAAGDRRPLSELADRLRRDGVRAVSPNGVLGDPSGASAAEGERLLTELAGDCATALDALLALLAPAEAHA